VRRAGGAAALSAVIASLVTLLVAMVVVDRRVVQDAEDDALARAQAFVRELDEEWRAARDIDHGQLEDEVAEFTHGGSEIAVVDPTGRLAGSKRIPDLDHDGCTSVAATASAATETAEPWLVCRATATATNHWVLVGEPRASVVAHRQSLLTGGLVALFIVALGGVVAGAVVGRWSLRPLVELRGALDAIDIGDHGGVAPLPRSGLSELDALAETLDVVLARLHDELERSRLFAADAAHELRTPLTKLRTELELLLEDHEGAEAVVIQRQVARIEDLAALIDRLLLLASPESTLRGAAHVSMAAVVEAVLDDLDGADRVEVDLADDGSVLGDATVLSAVVSNALGNALKFSEGPVKLAVHSDAGDVILRVDDEGPGLGELERERAFEGFFRAPEHRATKGHGIGLALIAHVVQAHDGTVGFVDGPPGAHLVIRLPALR